MCAAAGAADKDIGDALAGSVHASMDDGCGDRIACPLRRLSGRAGDQHGQRLHHSRPVRTLDRSGSDFCRRLHAGSLADRFCDEFPAPGRIILTVDLVAERLRAFPIEVRVVREPGGTLSETDDLAPLTVAFMPAQTYPGGAVVIDHEYAESGRYAAFLTVSEPSGLRRTTRFAFVVGSAFRFFAPAMLGGVFLAGLVFAYWRHSGNRRGMRKAY